MRESELKEIEHFINVADKAWKGSGRLGRIIGTLLWVIEASKDNEHPLHETIRDLIAAVREK